jgi:hypothetical protein
LGQGCATTIFIDSQKAEIDKGVVSSFFARFGYRVKSKLLQIKRNPVSVEWGTLSLAHRWFRLDPIEAILANPEKCVGNNVSNRNGISVQRHTSQSQVDEVPMYLQILGEESKFCRRPNRKGKVSQSNWW